MGNSKRTWWIMIECVCRILGVSTATVLCGVGVETFQQGTFSSLGIYLIVSSVAIMMFELAYFLDALLSMCLPCPPDWQLFVLWGKMARVGGFYKFMYYSVLSLVCFLHPVLVWHAVIPGSMLLVTALFNYILSKKTKTKSPDSSQESSNSQDLTSVSLAERSGSDGTFSFFHRVTERSEGLPLSNKDCLGERGESTQAILVKEETASPKDTHRQKRRRWKEKGLMFLRGREEPVEREMEEMVVYNEHEPDTTSDTAPMITD